MTARIQASVPGKVILMGEHAAVYGKTALVAAVGRRVRVELSEGQSGVEMDLRALGVRQRCSWPELLEYRDRKLDAWADFDDGRVPGFETVRGTDAAHVVKIALGEVARDVAGGGDPDLPPVRVVIDSELPVGSGFGSSAAVAVGVVASSLRLLGGATDEDRIARLAMEVERRQHGHPSGIDHHTVIRGGIRVFCGSGAGRRLQVADWVKREFSLFDTGPPAESTGDVVEAVGRRRDQGSASFDEDLDRMEATVTRFERLLGAPRPDVELLTSAIGGFEAWLEALGVVPAPVRRAIERLTALGACGKISGAGSLAGAGAGCLLVYRSQELGARVEEVLEGFSPIEGQIGVDGLSIQEVA